MKARQDGTAWLPQKGCLQPGRIGGTSRETLSLGEMNNSRLSRAIISHPGE